MPITFTYDIEAAEDRSDDRARINLSFRRFGWESLGGSSWRFPKLARQALSTEDWMNHVIPALMVFKAIVISQKLNVQSYSLDGSVHSGVRTDNDIIGSKIAASHEVELFDPNVKEARSAKLSESRLRTLLENMEKFDASK